MRTMRGLLVLLLVGGSLAAAPAWNVSGTWSGFVGDLRLTQAADGSLGGVFQMKVGCTEAYTVSGHIEGSRVALALSRASGAGDTPPCAATQTLTGTVAANGRSMSLALVNAMQSSPAAPFTGTATPLAVTTTTVAKARTATVVRSVFVACRKSQTQLCPVAYTTTLRTAAGPLALSFSAATSHCSDARFRFSVDGGRERVSPFVQPGGSTPVYTSTVGAGTHRIVVRAEGRRGGCNRGALVGWGGRLTIAYTR